MAHNPYFEQLFTPTNIGSLTLRNRIVMMPMGTDYGGADGSVTQRIKDYYEERAKGGAGLVIVEFTTIDFLCGRARSCQLAIDNDERISGLSELARVIQQHGAKAAIQIHHAGPGTKSSIIGSQPLGPSAIAPGRSEIPRELALNEIERMITRYAQAAFRAQQAGFDAVEIHAGGRYLIATFLSSAWNKRTDSYGGNLRNRARFLLEVVGAVRRTVKPAFPVLCRLNGEGTGAEDKTIALEEIQQVARWLEEAGVNAVRAVGTQASRPMYFHPQGTWIPFAEKLKQAVTIPVMAVGRIDPLLGERILQEKKADLIGIGRGLLADPELPLKASSGKLGEIRPCIVCGVCNDTVSHGDQPVKCTVNAALGKERDYQIHPIARPKSVLIIGGGPAGMEAARVAASRGHKVTLIEKNNTLGGQMNLSSLPPHKQVIEEFKRYLTGQIEKLGVKVVLNKEATLESVKKVKPDAVILATGSTPFIPSIQGIAKADVVKAEDALTGRAKVGDRVVVIGAELVGCETAEFLAAKGKKVIVTDIKETIAEKMGVSSRQPLLDRLAGLGVVFITGLKYEALTDEGLLVNSKDEKRRTLQADTIVIAAGSLPDNRLFTSLQGKVPEVYAIGDCVEPRNMVQAIEDGSRAARML